MGCIVKISFAGGILPVNEPKSTIKGLSVTIKMPRVKRGIFKIFKNLIFSFLLVKFFHRVQNGAWFGFALDVWMCCFLGINVFLFSWFRLFQDNWVLVFFGCLDLDKRTCIV